MARTRLEFTKTEARIVLDPAFADAEAMRRVTEAILAGYRSIGRWLLWDQERAMAEVQFRHAAPGAETCAFYRALFGEEVTFGAPVGHAVDMLVIDAALVTQALPNANPALVQLLTGRLNARLGAYMAGSSMRMLVISGLH